MSFQALPFPTGTTLLSAFRDHVLRNGQGTALLTPERAWTYAELDRWSDAIAAAILLRMGPGQAQVAMLFDQGAPNVATTLGILKAGKCYVPLDPTHAAERSADLYAFAEATLLVADDEHIALGEAIVHDRRSILALKSIGDVASPDVPIVNETDQAYIFFTSGSTGKPKGVVDSHRNVLHNIYRYSNALHITEDDRLTMIQSPTFSGTVSSLFCALLNGATLLPFDVKRHGFAALGAWLLEARATIYHSVPSIYRGVVEAVPRQPYIRVVRLEGDGAARKDLELFGSAFSPDAILAHGLGATETGLSCQYRMKADAQFEGERLPIGMPLPDMDVRIVGADGEPVPQGEIGELEVRSEFLATGYWRAPELTTERFAPIQGSVRAYRSGDLGRVDEQGRFVHLGRKDLEHKISGQWVNIGEVENALRAVGSFREVMALTRQDGLDDPRLVAYVVLQHGYTEDIPTWREALRNTLPDHMVPRHFVVLEKMPVTEHGKVDRRALPAPAVVTTGDTSDPSDPQEREMSLIWEQVLGVAHVGPTDDFFDLGGMSINALRILTVVSKRWKVDVQLAELYKAPTVRSLLNVIAEHGGAPRWTNLTEIRPEGTSIPIVCVHGDEANHHLAKLLPSKHPFLAFFHQGEDGAEIKHTSISAMADHYFRELEEATATGPLVLIGYSMGGNVALEMAHRLRAKGRDVPLLVLIDTFGPDRPAPSWTIKRALLRVRDAYDRWRCGRFVRAGRSVPAELRTFYIMDTYTRAFKHYRSPGWDGRVLLIRSQFETHDVSGWDGHCPDMTTVIVPGDHLTIVKPGQIGAVAQHIQKELERS
ncbi:MAG: alpha/beta fold hydrolase [Flavobacteriales bacterium]|nr:alpha/beta fold hydrolase [Flavobacteriales bacterium]